MAMKANVGMIDRGARFVVGAALIAATLTHTIGLWGWIGIIPLATSVVGFCPAYRIFGFSTCPLAKR